MSLKQWAAIFVGLTAYWWVTGREIARAWADPQPVYHTWRLPGILTLPWSGIADAITGGRAGQPSRPVNGTVTAVGAALNGLLFAFAVWRGGRGGRPLPGPAADYTDGPAGALSDGQAGPPAR